MLDFFSVRFRACSVLLLGKPIKVEVNKVDGIVGLLSGSVKCEDAVLILQAE